MSPAAKEKTETFALPNGEHIKQSDTIHAQYAHLFSQLGRDIVEGLRGVFESRHSLSREDIEHILRLHVKVGQNKILRGYFSRFLDLPTERLYAINRAIENFSTNNWTDEDWAVFGDLAPKSITKSKKVVEKASLTRKSKKIPSFALLQQDYTGKGLPRDWGAR